MTALLKHKWLLGYGKTITEINNVDTEDVCPSDSVSNTGNLNLNYRPRSTLWKV